QRSEAVRIPKLAVARNCTALPENAVLVIPLYGSAANDITIVEDGLTIRGDSSRGSNGLNCVAVMNVYMLGASTTACSQGLSARASVVAGAAAGARSDAARAGRIGSAGIIGRWTFSSALGAAASLSVLRATAA